jgi:hypothetical protein
MRQQQKNLRHIPLPFSEGLMSATLWQSQKRYVASVSELAIHCWGASESEASFRLFNTLIKYYRQLETHKDELDQTKQGHFDLLSAWIKGVEARLTSAESDRQNDSVVSINRGARVLSR